MVQFPVSTIAYDFIIRINSPRITEFRPGEDLTKLYKKRQRLGRAPLCNYQIVDLSKTIKAHLRQADAEGEGGVRFHWRRGHFKLLSGPRYKEPGLHWWTPHTAGRKVYGEIEKDYVASPPRPPKTPVPDATRRSHWMTSTPAPRPRTAKPAGASCVSSGTERR